MSVRENQQSRDTGKVGHNIQNEDKQNKHRKQTDEQNGLHHKTWKMWHHNGYSDGHIHIDYGCKEGVDGNYIGTPTICIRFIPKVSVVHNGENYIVFLYHVYLGTY